MINLIKCNDKLILDLYFFVLIKLYLNELYKHETNKLIVQNATNQTPKKTSHT